RRAGSAGAASVSVFTRCKQRLETADAGAWPPHRGIRRNEGSVSSSLRSDDRGRRLGGAAFFRRKQDCCPPLGGRATFGFTQGRIVPNGRRTADGYRDRQTARL